MSTILLIFQAFLGLFCLCIASQEVRVEDTLKKITYKGISHNGIESFYNIPYGEDVDGEKRFTRSVAKRVAQGSTIDATKPGAACPQQKVPLPGFPFFSNVTNVSENCLNLRVDRAANHSSKELLPVMVWFYGGGMSIGQVNDKVYTPTGLLLGAAAKNIPVLYVAMNYRLNIFGFADSDALREESNTNVGLLDQRLALQWVKDNIKMFGGDPDNVTLFGESAGGEPKWSLKDSLYMLDTEDYKGNSIGLQMTAYGGEKDAGLFKRAIIDSGSPAAAAGLISNTSSVGTLAVAKALKCPQSPSKATLRCLRAAPLPALLNATINYELEQSPPYGFSVFLQYIDGTFLRDTPSELIRQGKFAKNVSAIIGWNLDDNSLFTSPTIRNESDVAAYLEQQGLSKPNIARALDLYPASQFKAGNNASASYYRASRIGRDLQMTCPSLAFVQAISKYSPHVAQESFLFQLDQTPLATFYEDGGMPYYGVSHFSDIFYLFNEIQGLKDEYGATNSDLRLGSRMSGSWASFATSGRPGSVKGRAANATLTKWESAFERNGAVNVFAIGGQQEGNVPINNKTTHTGLDELLRRCRFFTNASVYTPN